jgi:hypothetical protein
MQHFPNFPAESGLGYVYFSKRGPDLFKIGMCQNLEKRRKAHRTTDFAFSYDYVRETLEYKACEAFLKAHFEGRRTSRTEETFSVSESEIEGAFPKALEYANALHQGRERLNELRVAESVQTEIAATEELLEMHACLKHLCAAIDDLESKVDIIKLNLALAIGNNAGITGLVSYKTQPKLDLVNREELAEILKVERPELYERFWQNTTTRPLRIL